MAAITGVACLVSRREQLNVKLAAQNMSTARQQNPRPPPRRDSYGSLESNLESEINPPLSAPRAPPGSQPPGPECR